MGAAEYTKKEGVSQKLNRLSYNSTLSHLRKCVLQMDASAKVVAPHLLHSTQWGIFDPVDSPDGEDIGLHKHLAICTRITDGYSKDVIIKILEDLGIDIVKLNKSTPTDLHTFVKLFINGQWYGSVHTPRELTDSLISMRRHGQIPSSTSISWNIQENAIYIYTDAGRLQRPLFYVDHDRNLSYDPKRDDALSWSELTTGTAESPCKIEYVDADESNTYLITFDRTLDFTKTLHTHVELHGSTTLGFMGNQIIFPEHNQLPRDCFSCSQSKQAVSMYNTNYQNRMDTMGVVLNYGQVPLVQSSFFESFKSLPYGINAIVAIMCYTGYNTEDAILINRGALDRGIFNTSYFKTYEESEMYSDDPEKILAFEPGSNTDAYGLVKENTLVNEDTVLMQMSHGGKIKNIYPNKDQVGRVDRTFISEDAVGRRVAKVRICTERIPELGDKFASRAGQKGTCGLIIPEIDMPFTSRGIRPDLIINPHALPSRMTIGQLVESLIGKVHVFNGGLGDCTAFNTTEPSAFKEQLKKMGYHSSGTEILYNGMSGEPVESNIFIGPTYYMRLKHMVSDKINFRPRGPNSALTRQPLQGRSNEGGLRIGEMERDGLIGNGMARFIQESMMVRGDGTMMVNNSRVPYRICVDNATGLLSIYNENTNLKISPSLDGIEFDGGKLSTVSKYSKTFSVMNVPYCFKLLMQELAIMNVHMRLITSDSVPHLHTLNTQSIEKIAMLLFKQLPFTIYTVNQNELYVSPDNPVTLFQHKHLLPSLFPYIDSDSDLQRLLASARNITPRSYKSKYHISRCQYAIYNTNSKGIDTTMHYFWNKMKTGIFVRIKNNKVFDFVPFYNVEYRNDFYKKISKDSLEKYFTTYASLKKRKSEISKDPSTWHATDCLIRTEKETIAAPTEAYLSEFYDMLVETCSHRKINDCIFFMNRKDFPHLRKDWKETFGSIYGDTNLSADYFEKPFVPVVSQSTSENHADFAFPTGDDWQTICNTKMFAKSNYDYARHKTTVTYENKSTVPSDMPPWEKRKPVFFWRGQGTGCGNTSETNPRMKLDELSDQIPHLDARITRYTERTKGNFAEGKLTIEYLPPEKIVPPSVFVPMDKQLEYKFIINVEGNSAAYRFGSLFGLGFCIINVESKYKLWFEPMLKMLPAGHPDIEQCHCILVHHDLGDLAKTIEWCLENDAICKKIQENAMRFFQEHFTKEFIYDYVSDLCNSISTTLGVQQDMYDEVKEMVPSKKLSYLSYKQENPVSTNTSVIIVPFRDTGEQNRTEQLEQFLDHYKGMNVLVVEQTVGEKFNRGALLNIGYEYVTKMLPDITAFVMHDVDILLDDHIQQHYYGDDGKDIVHLGMLIQKDKYKGSVNFLGRVIRFSKQAYKELNGFPNTFYGWGGEDDALGNRIHASSTLDTTIYRPDEKKTGVELVTKRDILTTKDDHMMELNKVEELVNDTMVWKMNGLNSLQYSILEHKSIGDTCRKITVQLSSYETKVSPPKLSLVESKEEDDSSVIDGGESLESDKEKLTKVIFI